MPTNENREAVAKIIDPAAFMFSPGELDDKVYSASRAHAFDRADRILALIAAPMEAVAWRYPVLTARDEAVARMARAMRNGKAWPAVFQANTAEALAEDALAALEALAVIPTEGEGNDQTPKAFPPIRRYRRCCLSDVVLAYRVQGAVWLEQLPPATVSRLRNLDNSLLFKAAQRQVAILCDNGPPEVSNGLGGAYIDCRDARGLQAIGYCHSRAARAQKNYTGNRRHGLDRTSCYGTDAPCRLMSHGKPKSPVVVR